MSFKVSQKYNNNKKTKTNRFVECLEKSNPTAKQSEKM